jgi:N-acetylneuraminic acid mutarotase
VPTAFNDVYTLDFSDTETFRWAKLDMGDQPAPPPRARHTATVIGEGKILVFGGLDRRKRYNDVWVLDTMQKTWTCVVPEGKAPSPRAHHSATLVDNVLWVLGGYR